MYQSTITSPRLYTPTSSSPMGWTIMNITSTTDQIHNFKHSSYTFIYSASIFTFHILLHSISPNDLFTIYDNALLPTSSPSPLSPSIRISIFIADDNGIDCDIIIPSVMVL